MVKKFSYFGSTISNDGKFGADAKVRIVKAGNAFGCLKKSIAIFTNSCLSIAFKHACCVQGSGIDHTIIWF